MKANCPSSGSCLGAMKLCLAIVVCLGAIGNQSVQAVNCTTGSTTDCFESDFTSATCAAGQCSCKDPANFVPIPTGCAATVTVRVTKPVVTLEPGRTPEFLVGQTSFAKLICLTNDTGVTFTWEKDGTLITGATTAVYTFPDLDAGRAGSYVCVTSDGTVPKKSDALAITAITATAGLTTAPVVDGIPVKAATGAIITPLCTGIPYGATYKFQLTVGSTAGTLVDTVLQSDKDMGQITCKIDNPANVQNATSAAKSWNPTIVDDIERPTVTITAATAMISPAATQYVVKAGTTVTATCGTTPDSKYMEFGTTTIVYTFTDTGNTAAAPTVNQYTVMPTSGTHTITCTAAYGTKAAKTSDPVTVILNDNYVLTPDLTSDPKGAVVSLGSRLVLTCGNLTTAPGLYTWTKNSTVIPQQRDRIIQYSKFTAADAGTYVCTANLPPFAGFVSKPLEVKAAANSLHVLGSTLLLALVALASSKIL